VALRSSNWPQSRVGPVVLCDRKLLALLCGLLLGRSRSEVLGGGGGAGGSGYWDISGIILMPTWAYLCPCGNA
jgi:hypothetical protein